MRFTEFSVACGIGESTLSILNSTLSHQSKEVISLASTDAAIISELYCDNIKRRKSIIVTALGFTNAFGSVLHKMIFNT